MQRPYFGTNMPTCKPQLNWLSTHSPRNLKFNKFFACYIFILNRPFSLFYQNVLKQSIEEIWHVHEWNVMFLNNVGGLNLARSYKSTHAQTQISVTDNGHANNSCWVVFRFTIELLLLIYEESLYKQVHNEWMCTPT